MNDIELELTDQKSRKHQVVPSTETPIPTSDPIENIWSELVQFALQGDGSAAQASLDAGRPIYYAEDDTPDDQIIKEYPSGRRELVRVDITGVKPDEVVRVL